MIFILLYQCFAGTLAWINYQILKRTGDIRRAIHLMNGALHFAASSYIGYSTEWNYGVSCLLFTRVVFDTVFNILRKKNIGYISPAPDSWLDQGERWLILRITALVHKKRTFIAKERIEWIAIYFRLFILLTATILLFL